MRKHWLRYAVVFGFAGISGAALLHTSQDVQQAEDRLHAIRSAVESERESIRVLETEWSYLNNPARLELLAAQYLELAPPLPGQTLATPAALPEPFIPVIPESKPDLLMAAQPAVLTAPAEAVSDAPPAISQIVIPKSKPKNLPATVAKSQPRKDFNDLLDQLSGGAP